MQSKIDFYKYLIPESTPSEVVLDAIENLDRTEKVYKGLNKFENYYFSFAKEEDLRRIYMPFKDKECITTLAKCTETVIGHIIKPHKIVSESDVVFNNHEFQLPTLLAKMYVLDILNFPEQLQAGEMKEATAQYEKFIRSDKLIAEKKRLLAQIGYTYIIHYNPERIVTYVCLDDK